MKKIILALIVFVLCVCLGACSEALCSHQWNEATCDTPRTCSLCGAISGDASGHDWEQATCLTPKTCSLCGAISGDALGHDWEQATCLTPKTCSACGETLGEALGHTTTTAICNRCGKNLCSWELSEFVDEFDRPTGEKYLVTVADGTFSNSATTNSELIAAVQVTSEDIAIFLFEYGRGNAVKCSYGTDKYSITVLDQNGKKHYFDGGMYEGTNRIYLYSSDKTEFLNLLKKGGEISIYLVNDKYTLSEYLFSIDATGFSSLYSQLR